MQQNYTDGVFVICGDHCQWVQKSFHITSSRSPILNFAFSSFGAVSAGRLETGWSLVRLSVMSSGVPIFPGIFTCFCISCLESIFYTYESLYITLFWPSKLWMQKPTSKVHKKRLSLIFMWYSSYGGRYSSYGGKIETCDSGNTANVTYKTL